MDYNKLRCELDDIFNTTKVITPETWHLDGIGNEVMSIIRNWLKEEVK